jgi:hypothetical protein
MMARLTHVNVWMFVLTASLLLLTPSMRAQEVATSFDQLRSLVKPGDTVYVTDASGHKTKGRLGELSASSLELLVRKTGPDGRDTFVPQARLSEGDVSQIVVQRRDSLLNGTLIGLAPGAAISLLFLVADGGCDCYDVGGRAGFAGGILLFAGGIGAAIGAAIDASITKRETVYYRAPGKRSPGVLVSPLLSKSGVGIQMSVRF